MQGIPTAAELRRRLARDTAVVPAALVPPASQGQADHAVIAPARLIETGPFTSRAVGTPCHWPGPVAFLDGTQHVEVIGYAGAAPIVRADLAAAVRERTGREARTVQSARRVIVIGRPEALAVAGPALDDVETVALDALESTHPIRDLEAARAAADAARGEIERRVGTAYRAGSSHWLVVDGSLAVSPAWAADPKMLGVSKSHAALPFEGAELVTYLQLPAGHRSPVFQPASRQRAPLYAWGLRLWPWEGKDLLYGLVRIEAAPTPDTLARADEMSRWLLAERAPVSAPDARWDRLLYGVRGVEDFLRASRSVS